MVDEQDWKAITSSEVFRNFVISQLQKEAAEESNKPSKEQVIDAKIDEMDMALTAMDDFEERIHKNPELLAKFRNVKAYLIRNPDVHDKVDSNFVKGIMMLDLKDGNDAETY